MVEKPIVTYCNPALRASEFSETNTYSHDAMKERGLRSS